MEEQNMKREKRGRKQHTGGLKKREKKDKKD